MTSLRRVLEGLICIFGVQGVVNNQADLLSCKVEIVGGTARPLIPPHPPHARARPVRLTR